MIPMSCPSCGRRGNVPLDRLNTRMHCKKCDAVFHLDPTGKPVLGEPPSARGGKGGKVGKGGKAARASNEPTDYIGLVAEKLANLPRPVWYVILTLVGAYGIYLAYGWFGPQPRTGKQLLAERADVAARAFVNRDLPTLEGMSTSDGKADLAKFVETFRPLVGDDGKSNDQINLTVMPPAEEKPSAEPEVEVTISPPFNPVASVSSDARAPEPLAIKLIWVFSNNQFYLNGKATLEANEEMEKERKAARAEAAKGLRK